MAVVRWQGQLSFDFNTAYDSKQYYQYIASNVSSSLCIKGIGPVHLKGVSNDEVIKFKGENRAKGYSSLH